MVVINNKRTLIVTNKDDNDELQKCASAVRTQSFFLVFFFVLFFFPFLFLTLITDTL